MARQPVAGVPHLWTPPYALAIASAFAFFCAFYLALAALPQYLRDDLGRSTGQIGVILGVFAAAAIVPRPVIGRLVNSGVLLAPMLAAAAIFALANALYIVATAIPLLILLRLFHGTGMAGYTTAAPALVAALTPAARRGEAMGFWGMANTLALALCPALGLAIAARWGYAALFAVSALLGVVAVVATALLAPYRPPRAARPAAPGGWIERRVLLPAVACFALMFGYGTLISFLVLLADARRIAGAGLFFTVYAAALLVARPLAGRLSDRHGRWVVVLPGLATLAVALVVASWAPSLTALLVVAALAGCGFGAAQPALLALTVDLALPERRGTAVATYYIAHESGIATASVALGYVAEAVTVGGMFAVAGGCVALIVALVALRVRRAAQARLVPA